VSDLLLLGLFGYLAFAHVRNGPLFALLAFGPAAVAATRALDRLPAAAGAAAAALALAAVTGVFVRSSEWGWRPYPDIFPSATADFILRHRPSGRLLNDMRSGGYLAWRLYPDYLVSVDGRTYYGQDLAMEVSDRVLGAEPGWRETVERYGVSMVATSPVNFMSGALPRVVFELDRDPAWMPVVADVTGLLFVRRSALPGALALPRERVWSLVRYLAGELAEVLPRSPEVYLTQGTASFRLHDFARAAKDFARYCELAPGDRETAALAQKLAAAAAGDRAALLFAEALFAQSGAPGP